MIAIGWFGEKFARGGEAGFENGEWGKVSNALRWSSILFFDSIEVELRDSVDKVQVFLHNGYALGMKGEQVGNFKSCDNEGLRRF